MGYADSIARLGRAAATLVAATQRPTQKAVGQGAVRSQMNLRICFRVRERRDVDLILGQGMLAAGWHARTLNAPGKFLVSSPEHDTPRRARAYLVTDQEVAETVARNAASRPELDEVSRGAIQPASDQGTDWNEGRAESNGQHQEEPPDAVPQPVPARPGRPRRTGRLRTLARGHHRGASQ
jgi:DNA segregation ATPase FtsK/SpoIIIE-like protein